MQLKILNGHNFSVHCMGKYYSAVIVTGYYWLSIRFNWLSTMHVQGEGVLHRLTNNLPLTLSLAKMNGMSSSWLTTLSKSTSGSNRFPSIPNTSTHTSSSTLSFRSLPSSVRNGWARGKGRGRGRGEQLFYCKPVRVIQVYKEVSNIIIIMYVHVCSIALTIHVPKSDLKMCGMTHQKQFLDWSLMLWDISNHFEQ